MQFTTDLIVIGLMYAVGIFSVASYALAALWAARTSLNWLARLAPLALMLAALVPLGAYDLLIIYSSEAIVVLLTFSRKRRLGAWWGVRGSTASGNNAKSEPAAR